MKLPSGFPLLLCGGHEGRRGEEQRSGEEDLGGRRLHPYRPPNLENSTP